MIKTIANIGLNLCFMLLFSLVVCRLLHEFTSLEVTFWAEVIFGAFLANVALLALSVRYLPQALLFPPNRTPGME